MKSLEGRTVKIVGDLWKSINLDHIMGNGFLSGSTVEIIKDTGDEVVFRPEDTDLLPGNMEKVVVSKRATERSELNSARELVYDNVEVFP